MNLPELCIRRPVMTTLLMAAFVIFGVIAYRALPVSELPNVDFPDESGAHTAEEIELAAESLGHALLRRPASVLRVRKRP